MRAFIIHSLCEYGFYWKIIFHVGVGMQQWQPLLRRLNTDELVCFYFFKKNVGGHRLAVTDCLSSRLNCLSSIHFSTNLLDSYFDRHGPFNTFNHFSSFFRFQEDYSVVKIPGNKVCDTCNKVVKDNNHWFSYDKFSIEAYRKSGQLLWILQQQWRTETTMPTANKTSAFFQRCKRSSKRRHNTIKIRIKT